MDFGKLAKRAKGVAEQHGDKIAGAVDKATDAVDKRTKGKHSANLQKINEAARKLDKRPNDDPPAP
ncbi:MAG: antitoxin [Acidimicrobiales bacterium]|nr:antitoxin [Acidimicrobiales bacterium]